MGNNGRLEGARHAARRKAEFLVRTNAVERREPSPEEALRLFAAIVSKDNSYLSITRLAPLQLNLLYPTTRQGPIHAVGFGDGVEDASPVPRSLHPLRMDPSVTMIALACILGRDRIVHALLRAGGNIVLRDPHFCDYDDASVESLSTGVSQFLLALPAQYAVYLMRKVLRMRSRGLELLDSGTTLGEIFPDKLIPKDRKLMNEKEQENSALVDVKIRQQKEAPLMQCASCGKKPLKGPLLWPVCEHACCCGCLWRHLMSTDREIDVTTTILPAYIPSPPPPAHKPMCCPVCGRGMDDERTYSLHQLLKDLGGELLASHSNKGTDCISGDDNDSLSPSLVRDLSRHKWEELPLYFKNVSLKTKTLSKREKKALKVDYWKAHPKPKFRAKPLSSFASECLGHSRFQRTEELLKAASQGHQQRILYLVREGVDIDAVNEYGLSALHLAALVGDLDSVETLVRCGASLCRRQCWKEAAQQQFPQADGMETPLHVADRYGRSDISVFLRHEFQLPLLHQNTFAKKNHDPVAPELSYRRDYRVSVLIPFKSDHDGAFMVDNLLPETFLERLSNLHERLHPSTTLEDEGADASKLCSERRYYCDLMGWIRRGLSDGLGAVVAQDLSDHLESQSCSIEVFPHMRFLHYDKRTIYLSPHVDLSRKDTNSGRLSTHTFIVYLTHTEEGGETALLHRVDKGIRHELEARNGRSCPQSDGERVIAMVTPRRGRILLFPHMTPHEARPCLIPPKTLLRGEIRIGK